MRSTTNFAPRAASVGAVWGSMSSTVAAAAGGAAGHQSHRGCRYENQAAGTVISQTGGHPRVSALVYVAARAPEAGEDYGALAGTFPSAPASAGLVHSPDGFAQLSEEAFVNDFANGVDPGEAKVLYAVQGRISDTLFASRTTEAAWQTKPCWYAISREDRTTDPDLERFLAKRMNATQIELDSGHLSLVTHPREIADLILEAAGRPVGKR